MAWHHIINSPLAPLFIHRVEQAISRRIFAADFKNLTCKKLGTLPSSHTLTTAKQHW
jgi:hypothetical protein